MINQIKKYKFMILVIFIGIVLVSVIPLTVNSLASNGIFKGSSGEFNSWLGFWGSFFGGIISGVLTLGGVYIGITHDRKNSLYLRYVSHKKRLDKFIEWVDDLKRTAHFVEGRKEIFESDFKAIIEDSESMIDSISGLDLNIYQDAKELVFEFRYLVLNNEQAKGTDEDIKSFAIKKIPTNLKDIDGIIARIYRRNEALEKDFRYF